MKNRIAVFPGSFSPFTLGHKSIIDKTLPLFDEIIISIGINTKKEEYININKRIECINDIYNEIDKVKVVKYTGLTIDHCRKTGANFIIRGIRNSNDYLYERDICITNKKLNDEIETIFIISDPELSHISSSIVREIMNNAGDLSEFVPKEIITKLI
tara:strand:+ start:3574 stop:4044 length:471 start_codon:yes stop_codon:yes gene_type:complete